jgi:hypothetical protein
MKVHWGNWMKRLNGRPSRWTFACANPSGIDAFAKMVADEQPEQVRKVIAWLVKYGLPPETMIELNLRVLEVRAERKRANRQSR